MNEHNYYQDEFLNAVNKYYDTQPSFQQYFQYAGRVESGSGWSYELRRAYSVTRLGLRHILESNQDNFLFHENLLELQQALRQQAVGTRLVAIVASTVFNPDDDKFHVYAIQNLKEKDVNHFYIYDSRKTSSYKSVYQNEKLIHQAFGLNTYLGIQDLKIYYPKERRQTYDDFEGVTYAIQDARLLMASPHRHPSRTGHREFSLPQELHYKVYDLHVKFFKELLDLDLKGYKGLANKPAAKPFSFLSQLSIGLAIALLSFFAYQQFQTEVTHHHLLP